MRSHELSYRGSKLHLADFGGEGRTLLLVHGLGGSHANFTAFAPLLAGSARVLALDLPGFGLSHPDAGLDVETFVGATRHVLSAIRAGEIEGASGPVLLLGNSMGGAVSILTANERPGDVAGLILVCPALPQESILHLDPRFALVLGTSLLPGYHAVMAERLRRAGPEALVAETLKLCCVDVSRVPPEAVRAMEELARRRLEFPWIGQAFSSAARSIVRTMARRGRFRDQMRAVRAPTLLVHGARDRLVPAASARAAISHCPHWTLEMFDDVGHVPQLEAPERLAESIRRFTSTSVPGS